MRIIIAEKPDLARAIVEALDGGKKESGYYDCGNTIVTYAFGHMLRLKTPDEYNPLYANKNVDLLPLHLLPFEKVPIKESNKQLQIIKGLLKEADEVVHAGDPDAEGQLLIDEILEYAKYKGPVKRVLINDNNTELVKKALNNLRPNEDFKGMSLAATARQVGDQIYGVRQM